MAEVRSDESDWRKTLMWAGIVPLAAVWVSFVLSASATDAWRSAGGALTLLGLGTIALGMEHLQAQFGDRPSVGQRIAGSLRVGRLWLLRKLGRKPEGTTHNVGLTSTVLASDSARAKVTPAPDADLEHRVEILEQEVESLRTRLREAEQISRKRNEKLIEKLRGEREERSEADRDLRGLVQQLAVGGLQLEFVGLCWLVLGVIMTTWHESLPALPF